MKKKLLAGILAAAMLMGLASATFATGNAADSSSVTVTANPTSAALKGTVQLTVVVKDAEGQDTNVTPQITLNSKLSSVSGTTVTIGEKETASEITVTATALGKTGTCKITVTNPYTEPTTPEPEDPNKPTTPDPEQPTTPGGTTTPGGSTSSGGGSSSGSTTTTTTPAEETVSTTEAVAKTEQAIEAAVKADPDVVVVVVKVKNAKSITAAALKAVAKAAEKAEKTPVIHADVVKDGKVESRLYIDPSLVKGNGEIKLGVTLGDEKVSTKFDKYFKNDIAVVKFDQAGSFGMNIKAAVKLDLSKLDTKNLVFYSYDPKTNRYTKMSVSDYRIDANGYLHFTTSVGNCVLVTDEPLARK